MASNSEIFSDATSTQENVDNSDSDESSTSFHSLSEQLQAGTLEDTEFAIPEEMKKSDKNNSFNSDDEKPDKEEQKRDKYYIDEDYLKDLDSNMPDEEKKVQQQSALEKKTEANDMFKKEMYIEAAQAYTDALLLCPYSCEKDRAILYANRAAARSKIDVKDETKGAVKDCTKAISLDPSYLKAILRRANLHMKLDDLEEAFKDYQKILEMDPRNAEAQHAVMTLPKQIEEKNEKLKEEMMDSSVPRTSATGKPSHKPWWNPECEKAVREKKRCYRRLQRLHNQEELTAYRRANAAARRVNRQARRAYENYLSTLTSPPTVISEEEK